MPVYIPMGENEMERIVGLLNARSSRGDGDLIVREYQPGDSVRSIHWKLMAKSVGTCVGGGLSRRCRLDSGGGNAGGGGFSG